MKRFLCPFLLLFFVCVVSGRVHARNDSLEFKIDSIGQALGITIHYTSHVKDIWEGVTYDLVTDDEALAAYLDILVKEYAKYPPRYINRCLINTVVLGNNVRFQGQLRAGVPDPYTGNLYLSVNGAYSDASFNYLVHVMHHELHHCAEYALWKDMMYDWGEWAALNTKDFKYGRGGVEAYDNLKVDYYSPINPKAGFVNLYSTTGDEEDRAELIAFLMTDPERPALIRLLKTDAVLKRKTERIMKLMVEFTEGAILFPSLIEP